MSAVNTVLIIDDETSIRSMLRIFLETKEYSVIEAEDGLQGIQLFSEKKPDIVISDIKMPNKDGIEVLKHIKRENPSTEVIMLTGHGDMELALVAIKLQAGDFLTKPFSTEQLMRSIDRAEIRLSAKKKILDLQKNLEKRVEEAIKDIQESHEFESALVNNTLNAVICFDKDRNIVMFNKWAEHITGYSEEESTKTDFIDIFPKDKAKIKKVLFEKYEDLPWLETTLTRKAGDEIPVKLSGKILHKKNEKDLLGIVLFVHDLSDVKKLEEDLNQANRFAIVGETVAGLAHCIKNILIGLEGSLYVVNKGIRKENFEKINKGWSMIENNIGRISDLSLQLLNFSKQRKPEYSICDPSAIVNDICDLMRKKAEDQGIKIIKNIQKSIGNHQFDKTAIHRCLLNLVANSIDALGKKEFGTGQVQVSVRHDDNSWLIIKIKDNGCGIDEATKNKLFDSVYSSKGSRGTGLGLLTTKKMITEHKGFLNLESEVGVGTTFRIKLPPNDSVQTETNSSLI